MGREFQVRVNMFLPRPNNQKGGLVYKNIELPLKKGQKTESVVDRRILHDLGHGLLLTGLSVRIWHV